MSVIALTIVRADNLTLQYQLIEDSAAKDITGMSFKLAVKTAAADAAYLMGPLDGTIDDAANGKFSFALTSVETDQTPFKGVYEIAMYDAGGAKTTLTGAGGVSFRLMEDIV